MRTAWVTLLLALTSLAGCSDDAPVTETVELGDGSRVDLDSGVAVSADAGAISGVVVDERIQPVAGANVTLGKERSTTTAVDGRFIFEDVAPGLYVLTISAPGFVTTQSTADVVAGVVAKPKVVLPMDVSQQPSQETLKFQGYAEASVGLVNYFLDIVVPTCTCGFNFSASRAGLDSIVLEVFWENSIEPPQGMYNVSFYYELYTDADDGDSGYGSYPLWKKFDDAAFTKGNEDFTLWVYPDDFWPSIQQEYEIFVTLFYVEGPPKGWSVTDA